MSEETTGTDPAATTTEAPAGTAPEGAPEGTDWKAEARKWETRAKENLNKVKELEPAQARLAELEAEGQTELQKAIARAEAAEQKLNAADTAARESLVTLVAEAKKVPAKYLTGNTVEELRASADEFLADIQAIAPDNKVGVIPTTGTGNPNPDVSSLDTGRARAQALLNN